MLYLIGDLPSTPAFQKGTTEQFLNWITAQKQFEFDVETSTEDSIVQRELKTVQFGNGYDQWVVDWDYINDEVKSSIFKLLEDRFILKIIHNAAYEMIIIRKYGHHIRNVFCTMLAEKVIFGGYDERTGVEFSLAGILQRRWGIYISKEEQLSFSEGLKNASQVLYAAGDVTYLTALKRQQMLELHLNDLEFVAALEFGAVRAFAEITFQGMKIDKKAWLKCADDAKPLLEAANEDLLREVNEDPALKKAFEEYGYVSTSDEFLANTNSPPQMKHIIQKVFPQINGSSKAIVKGFMKAATDLPDYFRNILQEFSEGNKQPLLNHVYSMDPEWMVKECYFRPKGTVTINWNSQPQVLKLFQAVDRKLSSLNKDSMSKFSHPIGAAFERYININKLITSFGVSFLEESVHPDDKVHTEINQLVSTGRISTKKPNMQQIPAKENVGNKYRNCFIPDSPDEVFVSSDYVSQELVVITFVTQEPVWKKAILAGHDLHSIMADLVYKDKWKKAGNKDCVYNLNKSKCDCKGHKRQRSSIKSINFGLAYGMSEFKLAADTRSTVPEAKALMKEYFSEVPHIEKTLTYFGNFGVRNGYIMTLSPFFRKRKFPYWKNYRNSIDEHIYGMRYHSGLGEIERASKNAPIQGSSADITKVALWLLIETLDEKSLWDIIKLKMQVHDQIDTTSPKDKAEWWAKELTTIMETAAKLVITDGSLKSETTISPVWTK